MKHLDLFSGIGGFAYAAQTVWQDEYELIAFCEIDKFCQKVLKKHWPDVPIIDDVKLIKGKDYETVDLITGGFPCQDLSTNGKRAGIKGVRSGLWKEYQRIIDEVRPRYAIMENVSGLLTGGGGRWFREFLSDLAEIGYDVQWHCISASSIGCNHRRERVFIVANSPSDRWDAISFYNQISSAHKRVSGQYCSTSNQEARWLSEADICRENDGIPNWVDRLKSLGNSIVPQVAMVIMEAIKQCHYSEQKNDKTNS